MYICTSDLLSQLECPVGTYSEGVSNSPCEPCPANRLSTQTGMAECPCDLEYYRAPDEGPSVACTREDFGLYLANLRYNRVGLVFMMQLRNYRSYSKVLKEPLSALEPLIAGC